jgi:hypothetical protein
MEKIYYKNIKANESKKRIINLVNLYNEKWEDYYSLKKMVESLPIEKQKSWEFHLNYRKKDWWEVINALELLNVATEEEES